MRVSYKSFNKLVIAFNSYKQAKEYAKKTGLKLAEYGDIYGSNYSYCYYNKSGDRNDGEKVIAYYGWENGKPKNAPIDWFKRYIFN